MLNLLNNKSLPMHIFHLKLAYNVVVDYIQTASNQCHIHVSFAWDYNPIHPRDNL